VHRERRLTQSIVERAERAGYECLVLTVDVRWLITFSALSWKRMLWSCISNRGALKPNPLSCGCFGRLPHT